MNGVSFVSYVEAVHAMLRAGGLVPVTNPTQSLAATSRHSSGRRPFEIADTVFADHGVPSDATVAVAGMAERAGAGSTNDGALIVNLRTLATIEALLARGVTPPVPVSQNLPGTGEHDRALCARYRGRLRGTGA